MAKRRGRDIYRDAMMDVGIQKYIADVAAEWAGIGVEMSNAHIAAIGDDETHPDVWSSRMRDVMYVMHEKMDDDGINVKMVPWGVIIDVIVNVTQDVFGVTLDRDVVRL